MRREITCGCICVYWPCVAESGLLALLGWSGLTLSVLFASQVVSILNPLIGEKVEQEIEEQILELQATLQQAQEQAGPGESAFCVPPTFGGVSIHCKGKRPTFCLLPVR